MRKKYLTILIIILITVFIIFIFVSLFLRKFDVEMQGMPKYDKSICYYSDGFQDYIDYCKYFYNERSIKEFEKHSSFKRVTEQDIENIKNYFENFSNWVVNTEYYNNYDFDISNIKINDYYYIKDKEGQPIGESIYKKYESYDVYYVDMENYILYFIHSNI